MIGPLLGTLPTNRGTHIVVGIDGSALANHALELTCRLGFHSPQHYVLVNAVEPGSGSDPDRYERESAGMAWLKVALRKVEDLDPKAEELQGHGSPNSVLIRIAEEEKADLIVVGHYRDSHGNVVKQLLTDCPRHLLIGRSPTYFPLNLAAVLTTGSSKEASLCVAEFIRLAPSGLRRVYVLAADELDWNDTGHAVSERLIQAGFDAEPISGEGADITTEICRACDEKMADFVIFADPPNANNTWPNGKNVPAAILSRCPQSLMVLRPFSPARYALPPQTKG